MEERNGPDTPSPDEDTRLIYISGLIALRRFKMHAAVT
jgi:hypothetical protein